MNAADMRTYTFNCENKHAGHVMWAPHVKPMMLYKYMKTSINCCNLSPHEKTRILARP